VAFSPDGTRVVTGSGDGTARLSDARFGIPLLDLKDHTEPVSGVAFSPDGTRLVTASYDKSARIWDAAPGREITLPPIPPLSWFRGPSPDGRFVGHQDGSRVCLIPMRLDFGEELDRRFLTRPDVRGHREALERAMREKNTFAAAFHRDRLLVNISTERPLWLAERSRHQSDNPALIARTAVHSPTIAKSGVGSLALWAAYGDPFALRLVGGLLIRNGEPVKAVGPLTVALALRSPDRPPVEELLLSLAHAKTGQMNEANTWHAKAVAWLDIYQRPMQLASALGTASADLWASLIEGVRDQADPRYNPLDWETWHECAVFRAEVEVLLKGR
jgi:hypothetical protein